MKCIFTGILLDELKDKGFRILESGDRFEIYNKKETTVCYFKIEEMKMYLYEISDELVAMNYCDVELCIKNIKYIYKKNKKHV